LLSAFFSFACELLVATDIQSFIEVEVVLGSIFTKIHLIQRSVILTEVQLQVNVVELAGVTEEVVFEGAGSGSISTNFHAEVTADMGIIIIAKVQIN
jgi:hypothetical protein